MPKRLPIHRPFPPETKRERWRREARDRDPGKQAMYHRASWRRARERFLCEYPLCRYCLRDGRSEPATVVDHVIPHDGDDALFWDPDNWQPLCTHCHQSRKQAEEHARRRR